MAITENDQLTPKEHVLLEAEKEEARLAREHAVTIKQLELAMKRDDNQAKVDLKRLEAKWSSWLRIPSLIIRLPFLIILAFGFVVAAIRKHDPGKSFWSLLS
jgi:hypothetical protein